jgi:hypothetical protein
VTVHLAGPALASNSVTAWDWLTFITGVVIGVLGIAVAIAVAVRQRVADRKRAAEELAAQRARDEVLHREREELESKIARRESWRIQYEKIDGLLDQMSDAAYRVRNQGPYTVAGFTTLDVETAKMRAERLAAGGIDALQEPLLRLVTLADQLLQAAVPDSATVGEPDLPGAYRLAVSQDRTAGDLLGQIGLTRDLLHGEWGR